MAYVYILKLKDGKYYVGSCRNLKRRIKQHTNGEVRSTKFNLPFMLVYAKEYTDYPKALVGEFRIKLWKKRKSIENLYKNDIDNVARKFGPVV